MKKHLGSILPLLFGIPTSSALAAEPLLTEQLDPYFRMLWGLFIVLGMMLVVYGLLRKRFNLMAHRPGKVIQVIEIQPLMPKKSLCLVQVKQQTLLVGVSDQAITLLATLDEKGQHNEEHHDQESFETILAKSQEPTP